MRFNQDISWDRGHHARDPSPPIAIERLKLLSDGRLLYQLKKKWRDGTSHIIFQPLELMERLAALVPAPRFNMIRYSGVLAPSAEWRRRIIPKDIEAPGVLSACTEKYGQNARVPGYTRERKHFPHLHGLFTVMLRQA